MSHIIRDPTQNQILKSVELKKLLEDNSWNGFNQIECRVCGETFCEDTQKMSIKLCRRHITQSHPEFCYKCTLCDEMFISRSEAKRHSVR